jgi:hypothetical protein
MKGPENGANSSGSQTEHSERPWAGVLVIEQTRPSALFSRAHAVAPARLPAIAWRRRVVAIAICVQVEDLDHRSRGQRPRTNPPNFPRPERASILLPK